MTEPAPVLTLTSTAFQNDGTIPAKFTCDGDNVSPDLSWSGVPAGTQSLVLLVDDPDIPEEIKQTRGIRVFDHWTLFNIPPDTRMILEGGTAGTSGANGRGQNAYTGPCPPKEYEPQEHRYFFRLYALDAMLSLEGGATKAAVLASVEGFVLGEAELVGRYHRP